MSLSSTTFSGRQGLGLGHPKALPPLRGARARVVCQAGKSPQGSNGERLREIMTVPVVAAMAAALMTGAVVPEAAWAARSGGRMGGSSFRAPRMAPGGGGGGYRYSGGYGGALVAPPLVGGYGYGGIMPFFPIGFGFGGVGIFQIFMVLFIVNAIYNAVRTSLDKKDNEGEDYWDDDF